MPKSKTINSSSYIHLTISGILMFLGLLGTPSQAYPISRDKNEVPVQSVSLNSINLAVRETADEDFPEHIYIPSIKVSIPVREGRITNGTWELDDHEALFAEGSSPLTEEYGNTIIYAHARKNLFKDLKSLKVGDNINVSGFEGDHFYKVVSLEHILPEELDKVKKIGSHSLTLFTCDGPEDKFRLLVRARKLDISNTVLAREKLPNGGELAPKHGEFSVQKDSRSLVSI